MVPFHESLTSCFNININAQLHLQQLTCNLLLLKFSVRYLHFSLSGSRNRGKKKHPHASLSQIFAGAMGGVYAQLKRAVDNSTNSCVLEFISEPDVATTTAPHATGSCTTKIGDNEAFRLSFRSCRSSLECFCAPMKEPGLITAKTAHGSHAYFILIYFVRPEAAGLKVPVGD